MWILSTNIHRIPFVHPYIVGLNVSLGKEEQEQIKK